MDAVTARSIAHYSHDGQRSRTGMPVIEHVERVAATVPHEARAVAFLHDVLERTDTGVAELAHHGLTELELRALRLLTREPDESYPLYILRIAHARGREGALARRVKVADLDDHLCEGPAYDAPPYAWARRRILASHEHRRTESPGDSPRAASA